VTGADRKLQRGSSTEHGCRFYKCRLWPAVWVGHDTGAECRGDYAPSLYRSFSGVGNKDFQHRSNAAMWMAVNAIGIENRGDKNRSTAGLGILPRFWGKFTTGEPGVPDGAADQQVLISRHYRARHATITEHVGFFNRLQELLGHAAYRRSRIKPPVSVTTRALIFVIALHRIRSRSVTRKIGDSANPGTVIWLTM